ncbi:MAG TPA: hypothetical protein PLG59_06975 [bacterium]|nr:hypothetical protein [bacterium]HQO34385.1 hypothetical protein [bacterium]HQP98127.1 hypothetical protein [bacterium]
MCGRILLSITVILALSIPSAGQDETLAIPGDDHGLNSLIQLLERKAMLESQDGLGTSPKNWDVGKGRPKPELGKRSADSEQPIDLSRYLGTEGDQEAAIRKLKEAGKWPGGTPQSESNSPPREEVDLFHKIPTGKRLDYVAECLKSGKYGDALSETSFVLATDPKDENLSRALALRLEAQYRLKKYAEAQDTYYRLRAYFPKGPEHSAALAFLEKESGVDQLQKAVRVSQDDAEAHRKLMNAYRTRGWLDLGADFYKEKLKEKTPESLRHLCELQYLREDWPGLVKAAEEGIERKPDSPEFHYNEGVGFFHAEEDAARMSARESFLKAIDLSKNAEFNKRASWYLQRLPKS